VTGALRPLIAGALQRERTDRLSIAVTRVLLLDLLPAGDRRGVDEAMERFIDLWQGEDRRAG
jgi:hypothetical protein